jgi:hypothetical protein
MTAKMQVTTRSVVGSHVADRQIVAENVCAFFP